MKSLIDILKCPVCGAGMRRENGTLFCTSARRHCYDVSSAGYVNLAGAKQAGGGDDAALIAARTAFLSEGHYAPIAQRICDILKGACVGGTVLDAGCGEGYYAAQMAKAGFSVFGLDLSKRGITHAAKSAKREGLNAFFAVAGIFTLPVANESVDAVVSVFAPVCEEEFLRVLKPGGLLIMVGAGAEHLLSLKRVLYDTAYQNEPRADLPKGMGLRENVRLRYTFAAQKDTLQNLFAMTPYFYRTSKQGGARLAATEALDVDVDVEIAVYQK